MSKLLWGVYLVAVIVFIAVLWIRIGEWDEHHEELQRRRNRTP